MNRDIIAILGGLIAGALVGMPFMMAGCLKKVDKNTSQKEYATNYLVDGVRRFENDEVICYYAYKTGMQCKFKK